MDIMRHKDIVAPVCIIKTVLNVLVAVPLALFAISVCADAEVGMKKDTVDAGTDMTTSIVEIGVEEHPEVSIQKMNHVQNTKHALIWI